MVATTPFLGYQELFGIVPEAAAPAGYGITPGVGTVAAITAANIGKTFVTQSEGLKKQGNLVYRDGLRGTRSRVGTDARLGPYTVAGTLTFQPTVADLSYLMQFGFGTNVAAAQQGIVLAPTAWALTDQIASFTAGAQRNTTVTSRMFRYTGCKCNRMTLSGTGGGLLTLSLDIIGQTEVIESATWPVATVPDVTAPYIFSDLTFTVNSVAREVKDFELVIDNMLDGGRFMNSTTIVNAPEQDRAISLRTTHAWDQVNADLNDIALGGFSGGTLVLTTGGHTHTFTFGLLQAPTNSPAADNRAENFLSVNWNAVKTGATLELAAAYA